RKRKDASSQFWYAVGVLALPGPFFNTVAKEAARIHHTVTKKYRKVRIQWFPAHAGNASDRNDNHNERAHAEARALTDRTSAGLPTWFNTKDRMTEYSEITKAFHLAHRTLPPPCPGLSREQAVLFRQLQTGSLPIPSLMHPMCPEMHPTDMCKVCRGMTASFTHILWNCTKRLYRLVREVRKDPTAKSGRIPTRLEAAAGSENQEDQHWAVQQVIDALARQRPGEPATASERV
ncbi:uncharacterized protein LOC144173794, partial [Haemaphysalis longicornis]